MNATKAARKAHAEGVDLLNRWFEWTPESATKRTRHAKHDLRWRRRKIAKKSRQRNRS